MSATLSTLDRKEVEHAVFLMWLIERGRLSEGEPTTGPMNARVYRELRLFREQITACAECGGPGPFGPSEDGSICADCAYHRATDEDDAYETQWGEEW